MPRIVILSDFASYIRINSQNLVVVDLRSIFRHRNFFKWPETYENNASVCRFSPFGK